MEIGPAVRPGRWIEKKKVRTGQDRTVKKKSQGGNISPIWGEAPTVPIETKICMAGNLADVITCAKFQDEIFWGYDFTGGRISHFPIDFRMGLTTVQRDCAACDNCIYLSIYGDNTIQLITKQASESSHCKTYGVTSRMLP